VPGIGDAIKRESEWLTSSGDRLLALRQVDGCPFKVVQGWMPRMPSTCVTSLYLVPGNYADAPVGEPAETRAAEGSGHQGESFSSRHRVLLWSMCLAAPASLAEMRPL
jgi:hypothetical protein